MSVPPILYMTTSLGSLPRLAATITLNRPDELNSMSAEMISAFDAALDLVEADPEVCVLFITGAGRSFSAGGDLKKYIELQKNPVEFAIFVSDLHRVFGRLRTLNVPTVALVNGVTAAGGLELILNCDLAFAAATAKIGDGHLNFGQMGGGGVLTLLSRFVGIQRASELMFSGKLLSAEEAAAWGIVNRIVNDDDLIKIAMEFAIQVASKSPLALANAKRVMNQIWLQQLSVTDGLKLELDVNVEYCTTSFDAPEGLQAFCEKRTPRFEGR